MADVQRSAAPATGPIGSAVPAEGAAAGFGGQRAATAKAARDKSVADAAAPPAPKDGSVAPAAPSKDEVAAAVKNANDALTASGTQLVFVFDDQLQHMTVKLLDVQTQKVVQQVPGLAMPAKASALAGAPASGALVDTKA